MKKRMIIALIITGALISLVFIHKYSKLMDFTRMMAGAAANPTTVSAMKVNYSAWQPELKAYGSLRAIRGVDVTTEVAGMVQTINFHPGTYVRQGDLLVQLNIAPDLALLNSLQTLAELAKITYIRDKSQFAVHGISKATLDFDLADMKSKQAKVAEQKALIAKKTIRAPFSGYLGISTINPGSFVNPGDKIVTLQELNPLYLDFAVPQQVLPKLEVGQSAKVTVDTFVNQLFSAKVSTINPKIENDTRNVTVEAIVVNSKLQLKPGMFASIKVATGKPQQFLVLPQTAIVFNPYGQIVFVVKENEKIKNQDGKPALTVAQTFVTTGETRGDQIQILKGLKPGDTVVTSGQIKLKNGSLVTIDNTVVPENSPTPNSANEK